MKSKVIMLLWVLTAFSLSSILVIPGVLAQTDTLTDSDGLVYYSNPSNYIDKKVNFTGKILTLLPPSSGTLGLQMYQTGDTSRNTIVVYSTPIQFSKDDCVRVIGETQPVTEYQNMFGARLSAAAIEAESIKKIECSESIEPAIKTINVNQTQEKNGIKITFDKVEFSDKNTRVYLTIENTGVSDDISFQSSNSRGIQDKSQFITTFSYDVDYPKIESTIPAGVIENGVILFEPMNVNDTDAKFRFETRDTSFDAIQFIFDVILSPVEYYDKLLSVTNDNTTLHSIGNSLFDLGNYSEAIKAYDKVLEIDPNDVYALANKAISLKKLGNYSEVIKYYDKALAIDPDNIEILDYKALYFYNLGNYTEAIQFADRVLAILPEYVDSLNVKAASYLNLGNYTEAIQFADKVLLIDPNYTYALINKGDALKNLGNYTEAIKAYDKVLEIDPNDITALENKNITLAELNSLTEAIESSNKFYPEDSNHFSTFTEKARFQEDLRNYSGAIEFYDKALDINPNSTAVLIDIGNAMNKLRNYSGAIEYYDRVLAIDPDNIWALIHKNETTKILNNFD
ncbi:tetratricopeptide repeat protein [Candidatus Nitrosocosmicus arcticus]|nr:tetratricopeptide repeat protein [Candidatus Nitrosocosmicus arcticus]